MNADASGVGMQVWSNPDAEEERASLFGLSADALHLAVVPPPELEQAATDLQQGRDLVKRTIPLATLTELEGEEGDQDLTLTFRVGAGSTESNTIQLATAAARDELLDALQSRLGPEWARERRPVGRFSAGKWPFIASLAIGGLTWFMHYEAQLIASGEHLKPAGRRPRTRAVGEVMHWVEGKIGATGVLIVGGALLALCVAWLLAAVLRPPVRITLRRHGADSGGER
jgi:hypothetical protein